MTTFVPDGAEVVLIWPLFVLPQVLVGGGVGGAGRQRRCQGGVCAGAGGINVHQTEGGGVAPDGQGALTSC
jgi:hypothetical protein